MTNTSKSRVLILVLVSLVLAIGLILGIQSLLPSGDLALSSSSTAHTDCYPVPPGGCMVADVPDCEMHDITVGVNDDSLRVSCAPDCAQGELWVVTPTDLDIDADTTISVIEDVQCFDPGEYCAEQSPVCADDVDVGACDGLTSELLDSDNLLPCEPDCTDGLTSSVVPGVDGDRHTPCGDYSCEQYPASPTPTPCEVDCGDTDGAGTTDDQRLLVCPPDCGDGTQSQLVPGEDGMPDRYTPCGSDYPIQPGGLYPPSSATEAP